MLCSNCGRDMRKERGSFYFKECGLDFVHLIDWPLFRCVSCEQLVPILSEFSYVITDAILEQLINPRRTLLGDEAGFIRKTLGFSSVEIAYRIGMDEKEMIEREEKCIIIPDPCASVLKGLAKVRIIANRIRPLAYPVFSSAIDPPRGSLRGKIFLYC